MPNDSLPDLIQIAPNHVTKIFLATQAADEPDPGLQPILPLYAQLLAEDSPADAIGWAERIERDEDREVVLVKVARAWRRADEAAAEAWLLESSLSEKAREKVRDPEIDRRTDWGLGSGHKQDRERRPNG